MSDYIEITFSDIQPEQKEMLIAHLSQAGYEGFEEKENELKAFIDEKKFDKFFLKELAYKHQVDYQQQQIKEQNWNAVWESSFQPVIIDDFAAVRADFHPPVINVQHEIIITPKMSFGTGHHATTYMMIQQMKDIDFVNKSVFDFGTGTGVLAILAEKLGANKVIAIDNDDWSIRNAEENIQRNNCSIINLELSDSAKQNETADIILANINKNVILNNLSILKDQLKPNGVLLISGLLREDETDILSKTEALRFKLILKAERHNWLCLRFSH